MQAPQPSLYLSATPFSPFDLALVVRPRHRRWCARQRLASQEALSFSAPALALQDSPHIGLVEKGACSAGSLPSQPTGLLQRALSQDGWRSLHPVSHFHGEAWHRCRQAFALASPSRSLWNSAGSAFHVLLSAAPASLASPPLAKSSSSPVRLFSLGGGGGRKPAISWIHTHEHVSKFC